MSLYYDMDGQPMDQGKWIQKFEDSDGRVVAQEHVGEFWVSTVWLGLDHSFSGNGPPLIFETMVFPAKDDEVTNWGELFGDRYSTKDAALQGHERVAEALRRGTKPEDI